jgi:hypothetical protein
VFYSPLNSTKAEIAQIIEYCSRCNTALASGELSPAGRVSTIGDLRRQADLITANERAAAASRGSPYSGVAGHTPDVTWTGNTVPPQGFMDMSKSINSSLGAQARRYPLGYMPTLFSYGGPR